MAERYRIQEGLVIGRKPMPSGDVILSFVGPIGASQAIARKAQRPVGRSGRLSLFHHLRYQVYQKPGSELPTLIQVELIGRLEGLEQPDRFPFASFLAELSFRLSSPDAAEKIWPILISGLKGSAKHDKPLLVTVWTGWRILKAAGLSPNLSGAGNHIFQGHKSSHGIFLGEEGMNALEAVLHQPGQVAVGLLESAPLGELFKALVAHIHYTVGDLSALVMLDSKNFPKQK